VEADRGSLRLCLALLKQPVLNHPWARRFRLRLRPVVREGDQLTGVEVLEHDSGQTYRWPPNDWSCPPAVSRR